MQKSPGGDIRDKVSPFLVPVGRIILGACLGVVLSMIGIGVAWGLFLFFGSQSITIWFWSLYFGAGLGAGVGGFFAWLRVDGDESLALALTAAITIGAGILGAWGGLEYGSTVEVECCAMPEKSPVYYTALGATAAANVAGLLIAAARGYRARYRQSQSLNKVR